MVQELASLTPETVKLDLEPTFRPLRPDRDA